MGNWTTSLYGRVTIACEGESAAMVHIYEDFPIGTWRLYRSILPGSEVVGERPGNKLRFEVPDRDFIAANQVAGGIDLHFEGVRVTIRMR